MKSAFVVKSSHKFDVDGFEAVTGWCDEIEANVNSGIRNMDWAVYSRF